LSSTLIYRRKIKTPDLLDKGLVITVGSTGKILLQDADGLPATSILRLEGSEGRGSLDRLPESAPEKRRGLGERGRNRTSKALG